MKLNQRSKKGSWKAKATAAARSHGSTATARGAAVRPVAPCLPARIDSHLRRAADPDRAREARKRIAGPAAASRALARGPEPRAQQSGGAGVPPGDRGLERCRAVDRGGLGVGTGL